GEFRKAVAENDGEAIFRTGLVDRHVDPVRLDHPRFRKAHHRTDSTSLSRAILLLMRAKDSSRRLFLHRTAAWDRFRPGPCWPHALTKSRNSVDMNGVHICGCGMTRARSRG